MSDERTLLILACDLRVTSGEGRLALLHLKNLENRLKKNHRCGSFQLKKSQKILSPNPRSDIRFVHSTLCYCWLLFHITRLRILGAENVFVLNYLPLWNFFFFLIVPKTFNLGPITGGGLVNDRHLSASIREKRLLQITRNILIPFLYELSSFIIRLRSLAVKPATQSVANKLNLKSTLPRAIEIDDTPFEAEKLHTKNRLRSIDFVSYVGDHPLKNTALTVLVLNRLAAIGYNVHLIGSVSVKTDINIKVNYHSVLPHKDVVDILRRSRCVFSLSLEEAGFFTFEAAVLGCLILCLPDSGGAAVPGAKLLANKAEHLTEELLFDRSVAALSLLSKRSNLERRSNALTLRKIHENAKTYFYQN